MSLEIIPSGAALGAEIRGVDLAHPLDDATFAAIERAYAAHGVVFFRDQRITPPQQVAFTRRFGEIEFNVFGERWSVPGSPEIVVVSNVTEDGRPIGVRRAGENWHSDMCYTARPPRGTMLHAIEVPELRGRKRAFPPTEAEVARFPPVQHPVVRTHPESGRKCLYVMRDDATGIEGLESEEALTLIAALADHIVKPAFVYRHQWRRGDALLWDNCLVQHRAIQDYDLPLRRLMHRTTMGGATPR